jgi:hypothetical protein
MYKSSYVRPGIIDCAVKRVFHRRLQRSIKIAIRGNADNLIRLE